MAEYELHLTGTARQRIEDVVSHIAVMDRERQGWGPQAQEQTAQTALSFVRGLGILIQAESVWADGAQGLSFAGRLPGPIYFGMIARQVNHEGQQFDHAPIEWTFHS